MERNRRLKRRSIISTTTIAIIVVVIVISMTGCGKSKETDSSASIDVIRIFFKLDPRLLGSTYGGERWVSPPTYGPILSSGETYTVEVRAEAIDKNGQSFDTNFKWTPEDPEMVTVASGQDDVVMITIKRAGESHLQVYSQGGKSKTLNIKSAYIQNNAIQVEISQ